MNAPAGSRRHLAHSPFSNRESEPAKEFAVDDQVSHDKYGVGKIATIEGSYAVTVIFGTERIRVKAPYTKLHKL